MSLKIKDKEKIQHINTKDKHRNLGYYKKKISFKDKGFIQEQTVQSYDNQTPQQYAVNKVIKREKITASQSVYRGKKMYYSKIKQRKRNRPNYRDKLKSLEKNLNRNHAFSFINRNQRSMMKSSHLKKYKQALGGKHSISSQIKSNAKRSAKATKNLGKIVKKTVGGISKLVSIGTGMLLIIVIVLFIGIFAVLGDDSNINTSLIPLSDEVIAYEEIIRKYAIQYEVEDYVPLIQAMMMQESGGKGGDPMQSSECEYNKKYPKRPNGITEVDYSIDCGVHYFSDCLALANVNSISDIKNISLALQGYNFGKGYITWAVKYFDGYTRANAKVFSDEMKAKLQTNVYGDPEYVLHVLRYYHIDNSNIVLVSKFY